MGPENGISNGKPELIPLRDGGFRLIRMKGVGVVKVELQAVKLLWFVWL